MVNEPRIGDVITADGPVPIREVLKILDALLEGHNEGCSSHLGMKAALDAVLTDPRIIGTRRRRRSPSDPAVKRGTRIPDDFTATPEMIAWAKEKYPWIDPREQTDRFCDFWASKPGQDACKLNWGLTWKNWIRSAADRVPEWKRVVPEPKRQHLTAAQAIAAPMPPVASWYDQEAM